MRAGAILEVVLVGGLALAARAAPGLDAAMGALCVGDAGRAEAALHQLARAAPGAGYGALLTRLFPEVPVEPLELALRRGRRCFELAPTRARVEPLRLLDLEVPGEAWLPGRGAAVLVESLSPGVEALYLYRQDGEGAVARLGPGRHRVRLPVASLAAGREPQVTLVARLAGGAALPLGTLRVDGADWRARQVRVTGPPRRRSEGRSYVLDVHVERPRGGYPRLRHFRVPPLEAPGGPVVLARDSADGRYLGEGTVLRDGSARLHLDLRGLALGAVAQVDLHVVGRDGTRGPVTTARVVGE